MSANISVYRSKRNAPSKADECKSLELSSAMRGQAATLVSGISDFASAIPFFGGLWQTAAGAISTGLLTAQASADISLIEMDCGDIPFDEIKQLINERLDAVDRAIDRNYAVLQEVSRTVSKTLVAVEQTRFEMNNQFERLFNVRIAAEISNLKSFIQDFDSERNKINNYSKANYIANIGEIKELLAYLEYLTLKKQTKSLDTMLDEMIATFQFPKSTDNENAFSSLYALYSGARALVSIHLFRYEQHSYIADYYYQNGKLDDFNEQFQDLREIKLNFERTFKIIEDTVKISKDIKDMYFIADNVELVQALTEQIDDLKALKGKLENLEISILEVDVIKLDHAVEFKNPTTGVVPVDWKSGNTVRYALQYKKGNKFSKIGQWSSPIAIKDKAYPFIRIPGDNNGFTRLVFRKFNDDNAQLVGVIKNKKETVFRDIDRDLYNAVSCLHNSEAESAVDVVNSLIKEKANITAAFDQGRKPIHAAAGCKYLHKDVIDMLLKSADINSRDDDDYTPMHIASEEGNSEFVQLLCEKGADVNARTRAHKLTPLHLAVRQDDLNTINNLVNCTSLKINIGDDNDMRAIHTAISRKSLPIVKALLKRKNINVNVPATKELITPLHMAAMSNHVDIAKALYKKSGNKLDFNVRTSDKLTPLHFAVMNDGTDMVDFFKDKNINVNARSKGNWTPLHRAVSLQKKDIVLKLLQWDGIEVNAKNSEGFTPLHIAAGSGQTDIVIKLLENSDIRPDETTNDGLTALHIASMHKNKEIVEMLVKKSNLNATTKKGLTPLLAAAKKGNWDNVQYLFNKHANICAKDNDGNDILGVCAANGQQAVLDYFFDDNYPVDKLLKLALENGHLNIVQYLTEKGKLDDVCTRVKNTIDYSCLLQEASKYKYVNIVVYLLNMSKSASLAIPAKIAAKHGHVKILEIYINRKPEELKPIFNELMKIGVAYGWYGIVKYLYEKHNVSIKNLGALSHSSGNPKLRTYFIENKYMAEKIDDDKNTLLHYALSPIDDSICINDEMKTGSIVKLLIEEGYDVNGKNSNGQTPMHMAAWSGCEYSVKLLILNKAELNPKDNKDLTPLAHLQNANKHPKIQELLKTQPICNAIVENKYVFLPGDNIDGECVDVNKKTVFQTRPLLLAISSGANDIAYVLLEKSDLSLTDETGNTPLHLAASSNQELLFRKLIDNGADIDAKNNNGETAETLAVKNNYSEIIKIINEKENANKQKRNIKIKRFANEAAYDDAKGNLKNAAEVLKYIIVTGCNLNTAKGNSTPLCLGNLNDKHGATEIKNGHCLDNNLSLGYILLQNYLNKKYPLPKFADLTPEDARASALKITQQFEKLLKKIVQKVDNFDFYQLYLDISKSIMKEQFSKVPKILTEFVKNACASGENLEN